MPYNMFQELDPNLTRPDYVGPGTKAGIELREANRNPLVTPIFDGTPVMVRGSRVHVFKVIEHSVYTAEQQRFFKNAKSGLKAVVLCRQRPVWRVPSYVRTVEFDSGKDTLISLVNESWQASVQGADKSPLLVVFMDTDEFMRSGKDVSKACYRGLIDHQSDLGKWGIQVLVGKVENGPDSEHDKQFSRVISIDPTGVVSTEIKPQIES
jgi:hypothetical protein